MIKIQNRIQFNAIFFKVWLPRRCTLRKAKNARVFKAPSQGSFNLLFIQYRIPNTK